MRLRRRIRWRDRRLATPPATSRVEWGYLTVVVLCVPCLLCSCALGFGQFDTLATGLRWAAGLIVALAIVALLVGIADDPRRSDAAWRHQMTNERDALQARLDRAERREGQHAARKRMDDSPARDDEQ